MKVKLLEVRDAATFLPVLCVEMAPGGIEDPFDQIEGTRLEAESLQQKAAQRYLLRRCGFPCDSEHSYVMMTPLRADGEPCSVNPEYWCDRTRLTAHRYITQHWHELKDGDVVDVEYILGERPAPKRSEREEVTCTLRSR